MPDPSEAREIALNHAVSLERVGRGAGQLSDDPDSSIVKTAEAFLAFLRPAPSTTVPVKITINGSFDAPADVVGVPYRESEARRSSPRGERAIQNAQTTFSHLGERLTILEEAFDSKLSAIRCGLDDACQAALDALQECADCEVPEDADPFAAPPTAGRKKTLHDLPEWEGPA